MTPAAQARTPTLRPAHFSGHGGLRLAADVGGPAHAPAVLLLHGAGQTRHSWGQAAEELLRQGYQVVVLDHRGHGDSAWSPEGDYSINAFAGDVRAVVRSLGVPVALVGASLGGLSALVALGEADAEPGAEPGTDTAPAHPAPAQAVNQPPSPPWAQQVAALVLVDVVSRVAPGGAARIRGFMDARPEGFASLEEAANAIASYMPHRPRPSNLEGLRKNLRQREDGRWYWHWDPAYTAARVSAAELGDRMEAAAAQVQAPTLILRGARSELVDEAGVRHLLRFLPHAEAAEVGGAHHMVAGDRNDAFNAAVEQFLGRHLPPGPALPAPNLSGAR